MKMGKLKFLSAYLIGIFMLFGVIFSSFAEAATSSSILVSMSPENPNPLENTTITLSSYADNLDTVLITWSVNGRNIASGIGKKSASVQAPASAAETRIVATIALPSGAIETRINLRPSSMALLWQADDSYVPPFYRGKALPTAESEIKVVAMPEIRNEAGLISPKNMTFAWKKDFTNSPGDSGYGKNFLIYTNDYLDGTNNVSVSATTVDGTKGTDANVNIATADPKILFYKKDDAQGTLWGRALPNPHTIDGSEILEAAPYFISPKEIQSPTILWSWFINDTPISITGIRKNVMPLKVPEGTTGTSKVRLHIENRSKIFQTADQEINIDF